MQYNVDIDSTTESKIPGVTFTSHSITKIPGVAFTSHIITKYMVENSDQQIECVICLKQMTVKLGKTCCNHIFHYRCIDRWVRSSASCPICRTLLSTK